jgi:hypothetical protein
MGLSFGPPLSDVKKNAMPEWHLIKRPFDTFRDVEKMPGI